MRKIICKCKNKIFLVIIIVISFIILINPNLNAQSNYEYINKEDMWDNLYLQTVNNLSSSRFDDCEYKKLLTEETTLTVSDEDSDLVEGHHIRDGGEYIPTECRPKFSTAIIVPYRDRAEQLRSFLVYMHTFLHHQQIHYRIYVIEQVDSQPFNRAKLMNIGVQRAMKAGFPCLVLHDVDLLPMQPANLYACSELPRHMSASINKFRFVLPYLTLFGGVIAISSHQYKATNGMSNLYFGWGGEDDDLFLRLEANDLKVCRFEPAISRFHMVAHRPEPRGSKNKELLKTAKERMSSDGLNTLKFTEVATVVHPLFTHIMVDL